MASESHPVAYEEQPFASTDGRYGSAHSTRQYLKRKLGSLIKDFLALSPVVTDVPNPFSWTPKSVLSYNRLGVSTAGCVSPCG
jgi:hypothetical protein